DEHGAHVMQVAPAAVSELENRPRSPVESRRFRPLPPRRSGGLFRGDGAGQIVLRAVEIGLEILKALARQLVHADVRHHRTHGAAGRKAAFPLSARSFTAAWNSCWSDTQGLERKRKLVRFGSNYPSHAESLDEAQYLRFSTGSCSATLNLRAK